MRSLLLVGLGNPGKRYSRTRHNVGAIVVKAFADLIADSTSARLTWTQERGHGATASAIVPLGSPSTETRVTLFLPNEHEMNILGPPVQRALRLLPADTLPIVFHDDLEMPWLKVKAKYGGSTGGHNGLESVNKALRTPAYWRLRLGIDRPASRHPDVVSRYVLGKFTEDEERAIHDVMVHNAWKSVEKIVARLQADEAKAALAEAMKKT